jgi:hypothetical protein
MAVGETMTNAEVFAEDVALRASSVLARRRTREGAFSVGGLTFRLVAPDGQDEPWLGRAFPDGHNGLDHPAEDSHRIVAWDGTSHDELPPPRPWLPSTTRPYGVAHSHSNDAVRCAFEAPVNSLIVYNYSQNSSCTWTPSIAELPGWAKATPFRIILSWLLNRHRMQIIHSAAVAINGRAVLLAGPGGSGKSTTSLACALAGLEYLGDDYCAVEPATGKVHMIYRTAKFFDSTVAMIPSLAASIDNRDEIGVEKSVIYLEPGDVRLTRSAELSAILLPRVGVESATTLHPATRDEAIKAILPSTIFGLMGGTSISPRLIMELAGSAPAYHLTLGTNLDTVIDTITSCLTAA